jgi:hypothetical protein
VILEELALKAGKPFGGELRFVIWMYEHLRAGGMVLTEASKLNEFGADLSSGGG